MSIASRITAITGHITDIYDTLELGGDTTENKNIININTEIKREYKNFLAHGVDVLWNNWEKVSGSGETLTLNNTMDGKMKVDLKGNTQQNGTPTPDTPIPVQVVSGDNTIKVEGANLFNKSNYQNLYTDYDYNAGGYRCKYIPLKPNTTYTVSFNAGTTFSGIFLLNNISNVNGVGFLDLRKTDELKTFTTDSTGNLYIGAYGSNDTDLNNRINSCNLQILTGTYTSQTIPTYQAYESQTYPISLGNIELCKIGDYQDRIYKDNGKWYLNKQIGKVVLDGSEDGWALDLTGTNTYRFNIDENTLANAQSGFCNNNQWVISGFSGDNQLIGKLNNKLYYRINKSIVDVQTGNTIVNQFKTWLSNNNIICCSLLETPTYEEITGELLSQLEALAYSYEGTTNVSQVNDDMPFILDMTMLKEMS